MNTEQLIDVDTPSTEPDHSAEIAELRAQLEKLQAERPAMEANLMRIEGNNSRTSAINPVPADAFTKRKATTLEGVEADAAAEMVEVSAQIRAFAIRAAEIKAEQGEVESALFAAEGRMKVLASPSRAAYVSARGELAAKALMGEAVDLAGVPAHDTAETMTVSDVQAGIMALKQRRDGLSAEYSRVRVDYRPLVLNYSRLHGVVNACRFIKAKRELAEATLGLLAAHAKSIEVVGSGSVASVNLGFLPLHFEHDFKVPMLNQVHLLKEINGYDNGVTTCEVLHTSGKVAHAVRELDKAMMGGSHE